MNDALKTLAQSSGLRPGQLARLMHAAPKTARRLLAGQNVGTRTLVRFVASARPSKGAWMGFRQQVIEGSEPKACYLEERQLEFGF